MGLPRGGQVCFEMLPIRRSSATYATTDSVLGDQPLFRDPFRSDARPPRDRVVCRA